MVDFDDWKYARERWNRATIKVDSPEFSLWLCDMHGSV